MSLIVYDYRMDPKDIASIGRIVDGNDKFFDINTPLMQTEKMLHILRTVDDVEYANAETVIAHRFDVGSRFNRTFLSTGAKTALNILSHPTICFALYECGNNVWREIMQFDLGIVYMPPSMYSWDDDLVCDLIYGGYHFTSLNAFMHFDLYTARLCDNKYRSDD